MPLRVGPRNIPHPTPKQRHRLSTGLSGEINSQTFTLKQKDPPTTFKLQDPPTPQLRSK